MIRIRDLSREGCRSSPEPDWPAAHSMDTTWYAVDDTGHVAVFFTGENGPVPDPRGANADLLEEAYTLLLGGDPDDLDVEEEAQALGVFFYDYIDQAILHGAEDRYGRGAAVQQPLHVDQLPPDLRAEWKRLRFPGLRFAEARYVQPFEFFKCQAYDTDAAAYLTAEGKTVRAIPGRQPEFRALVAEWREYLPEVVADFRIDEPK